VTAHVRSLRILRENVAAQVHASQRLTDAIADHAVKQDDRSLTRAAAVMSEGLALLLEQLDADCREVAADVEQIITGGQF
jgi:hypothetical protein